MIEANLDKPRRIRKFVLYGIFIYLAIFMVGFFASILLPEYLGERIFTLLMASGRYLLPFSLIALPFLTSKEREEETTKLLHHIKKYPPVVASVWKLKNETIEVVYSRTIHWIHSLGAVIQEESPWSRIIAFHQVIDSSNHGIGWSNKVENWEKFFVFTFHEESGNVRIEMEIMQGWKKIGRESYERRTSVWPRFLDEYGSYLGAVRESMSEIADESEDGSLSSFLFKRPSDLFPMGLGFALVLLASVAMLWAFPVLVKIEYLGVFIGLILAVSFGVFYKVIKG